MALALRLGVMVLVSQAIGKRTRCMVLVASCGSMAGNMKETGSGIEWMATAS